MCVSFVSLLDDCFIYVALSTLCHMVLVPCLQMIQQLPVSAATDIFSYGVVSCVVACTQTIHHYICSQCCVAQAVMLSCTCLSQCLFAGPSVCVAQYSTSLFSTVLVANCLAQSYQLCSPTASV